MIRTIKHGDNDILVVVAKLLTGYVSVTKKVIDPAAFIDQHKEFDAGFVASICTWQRDHDLTPDGIIGPATWTAISKAAPTCSTSKLRTSGITLAAQILLDTNITTDAIYGNRTKNAVAVFQNIKGLKSDGICGPKTWAALITDGHPVTETAQGTTETTQAAGTTEEPCEECKVWIKPVDYKQYDSRWGKKMYSNHGDAGQTMANSACGPTAMADIVATMKDAKKTPYDLAKLAISFGDRTYNSGTAWTFFIPHIMEHFGFSKAIQAASLAALKACLDARGYVVCSMAPGYWTKSGHFICAWKYDDEYIYCCDPASSTRTKQKITQFMKERKQFFCFYPEPVVGETTPTATQEAAETVTASAYGGTKIVDISKWQPTVDYDKLVADSALIILRAGYRGTGGGIKMDQKFELHATNLRKRGIRFGVYFYSIASTPAKAREEAQAFVKYAKEYDPLFYAMDAEKEEITHDAIAAFADELRKQGIDRIGCYVAHNHYKAYKYDTLRGLFDFTWIPRYGANTGTIEGSKKPSYKCDLWQFTSTGDIDGIDGNVDLNVITGTGKTLTWLLGGDA